MQSHWIERSEGFRTHYLHWQPAVPAAGLPVVCVHGNLSNAAMFRWIGELLASGAGGPQRRVIAPDLRGCGLSGLPEHGFGLSDFASDIEAAMGDAGITQAHIIAFSRGTASALRYAEEHPQVVQGFIVGDYPAYYPKLGEDWVRRAEEGYMLYGSWDELYEELSMSAGIDRATFEARKDQFYMEEGGIIRKKYARNLPERMFRESIDCNLAPALKHVGGPLLVLHGAERGSLLDEEQLAAYRAYALSVPSVLRIEGAGHDVYESRAQVREALTDFFSRVD